MIKLCMLTPSHGANTGSNPVRDASDFKRLAPIGGWLVSYPAKICSHLTNRQPRAPDRTCGGEPGAEQRAGIGVAYNNPGRRVSARHAIPPTNPSVLPSCTNAIRTGPRQKRFVHRSARSTSSR